MSQAIELGKCEGLYELVIPVMYIGFKVGKKKISFKGNVDGLCER